MYEGVKEILDDDFTVLFPEWLRGPFGLATYIRGFEAILMDMIDRPEFCHDIMQFIVEARESWYDSLSHYLGRSSGQVNLFNDEVNTPSLSPDPFAEFILPYELELARYHGGLLCYHSCGDLSALLPQIDRISRIDMVHKSPWTNSQTIAKYFGQRSAIEVCLNPQADICDGTEESLRTLLTGIVGAFTANKVKGYTLRANNIQIYKSLANSISKAKLFIRIAREVAERQNI